MGRRRIAIAGPSGTATQAAATVAESGGNAVDAAIAAICVAAVSEIGIVSPMGGAFVNVWAPGEGATVVDGNVAMPGRTRPPAAFGGGVREVWMGYYGGITVYGGHGSIATPGMFAALDEANRRWGAVPWSHLIEPAAHVARTGYPIGAASDYYLRYSGDTLFGWHEQTRAFMRQGGHDRPPQRGDILRSPDLADTLDAIARDGAATLYTGELAATIAADMDAHEGLLSAADLAAYSPVVRPALDSVLGRWRVGVNPAPSIGGPVLTAMLRLLAQRRRERGRTDPADIIDIQHRVLDYRRRAIDAAEDLTTAGRELLDLLDRLGPDGLAAVCASPETVHVSAVDDAGLACSITTSAGYGSGVTVPGTGLMMNNALGEPELNRRGLHALPVGTRLASNMAPSTARRDDGALLAVGTPGADRITTALLQVLGGACLEEYPLQEAIDRPRAHVAFGETGAARVEYERGEGMAEAARGSGLPTVEHGSLEMYFGGVAAALCRPGGILEAAADPRRAAGTVISG